MTRIALQRCDRFVGRTMNWMYDHLLALPRYRPLVLTDSLENRSEFPELEAWPWNQETLARRAWRRVGGRRPFPLDLSRLRGRDPALLHSHFGWVAAGDHDLRQALGVPWVVGFYGADVHELPARPEWLDRYERVFAEAACVLPLGPHMARRLEELGCPAEKVIVHNLGVDVGALAYSPRTRDPGQPLRILYAGTFREKKGVPDLIEALHLLHADGVPVHLDLVGDATPKPGDAEIKVEILAGIERWGLEGIVTRHPFLPFGELVELGRRCHVLATPSVTAASGDSEGTVFIIQQMMATGMPVVATRHADIPYTFGAMGEHLVPERDPEALAGALRRYVDDPEALEDDGRRFRVHAEETLDINVSAASLARIYDRVVEGVSPVTDGGAAIATPA
ncbi:MAG: glycosyltransferase [Gemmatimonadales bacterium]|nr:MAG: glycosyltransferase [Gemmatimonadales bacterium]